MWSSTGDLAWTFRGSMYLDCGESGQRRFKAGSISRRCISSHCGASCMKRPLAGERVPWLMFLLLAVVFFLVNHDLSYSKKGRENFNPSEDAIITGVTEGSLTRRIALLSLGVVAVVDLVRHRAKMRLRINGPLGWALLSFASWALISPIW